MSAPLLAIETVSKRFGGLLAVDKVAFDVGWLARAWAPGPG